MINTMINNDNDNEDNHNEDNDNEDNDNEPNDNGDNINNNHHPNVNDNNINENINNDERNLFNINDIVNENHSLMENLFNEIDNIFNINQPRMYHLILWINVLITRRVTVDYISTNILEIYAIFNDNYVNLDNIKHKTFLFLILYRRIHTLQNNRDALYNIMFHCLQLE